MTPSAPSRAVRSLAPSIQDQPTNFPIPRNVPCAQLKTAKSPAKATTRVLAERSSAGKRAGAAAASPRKAAVNRAKETRIHPSIFDARDPCSGTAGISGRNFPSVEEDPQDRMSPAVTAIWRVRESLPYSSGPRSRTTKIMEAAVATEKKIRMELWAAVE